MFESEREAIYAVLAKIPRDWVIDDIVGVSLPSLGADFADLEPGSVVPLR
jgi:hypothetical protein